MKQTVVFILLLAGFGLGFLANGYFCQPESETILHTDIKTEVVYDTVEVEKIVYRQLPAKIVQDTIFITREEIDSLEGENGIPIIIPEKASVDTVFNEYGKLWVDFYFFPRGENLLSRERFDFTRGEFDLMFDPFPQKIVRETRFVQIPIKWYKTQKVGFIAGVAAAAVTVYLVK